MMKGSAREVASLADETNPPALSLYPARKRQVVWHGEVAGVDKQDTIRTRRGRDTVFGIAIPNLHCVQLSPRDVVLSNTIAPGRSPPGPH